MIDDSIPLAIELLEEHNLPVSGLRSKNWTEFAGRAFSDALLTLRRRIELFSCLPLEKLTGLALRSELDRIGRT